MRRTDIKPTSIRLPDDLRAKIEALAERERRSVSNAIEVALVRYFACADKTKAAE